MATPTVNIVIDKGSYFENTFNISNSDGTVANLTGYTNAVARIKKHPGATTSYSFQTNVTLASGRIVVSMGHTTTSLLDVGRNYYDIFITSPGGDVLKVIEGTAIVNPSVSV